MPHRVVFCVEKNKGYAIMSSRQMARCVIYSADDLTTARSRSILCILKNLFGMDEASDEKNKLYWLWV